MAETAESEAAPPPAAAAAPPRPAADHRWALTAVLTLNAATGLVEAVAFAHLGGVFTAFVTGTVVLAGLQAAAGTFAMLIPYAVAFVGFIIGAVAGGILLGRAPGIARGTLRGLAGEITLFVLAVLSYALLPEGGALVTLGLLSAGMAIQFSATKNLKVTDLGFAAATGLIHGLVTDFTRRSSVRLPRKILALVTLLAGGTVGGLVSAFSIPVALLIATGLVAAAAVTIAAGSRLTWSSAR
jgi:uncharacterized membrane protein YoaK (UPF0700 family)